MAKFKGAKSDTTWKSKQIAIKEHTPWKNIRITMLCSVDELVGEACFPGSSKTTTEYKINDEIIKSAFGNYHKLSDKNHHWMKILVVKIWEIKKYSHSLKVSPYKIHINCKRTKEKLYSGKISSIVM